MEVGRQKSYTGKFKREVIRCAEEKGNRKAAAIFGVDESKVRLWRKYNAAHKAPGPDNITPQMIQELPSPGLKNYIIHPKCNTFTGILANNLQTRKGNIWR
jgi:hypothetical protein